MAGKNLKNTVVISDNLAEEINKLKQTNDSDIVIFGSPSAVRSLSQEKLIDDYWLYVNPVILGKGIPVFEGLKEKIKLRTVGTKTFPGGVVAIHYEKS